MLSVLTVGGRSLAFFSYSIVLQFALVKDSFVFVSLSGIAVPSTLHPCEYARHTEHVASSESIVNIGVAQLETLPSKSATPPNINPRGETRTTALVSVSSALRKIARSLGMLLSIVMCSLCFNS